MSSLSQLSNCRIVNAIQIETVSMNTELLSLQQRGKDLLVCNLLTLVQLELVVNILVTKLSAHGHRRAKTHHFAQSSQNGRSIGPALGGD